LENVYLNVKNFS